MSTAPSITARYEAWLATNPTDRRKLAYMAWIQDKWAQFRKENRLDPHFLNDSIQDAFDAWLTRNMP